MGDRRFDIVLRLPEHLRENVDILRRIPIPLSTAVKMDAQHTRTQSRMPWTTFASSTPVSRWSSPRYL